MDSLIEQLDANVKNLKILSDKHQQGHDVANEVYWVNEVILDNIKAFEFLTGADDKRKAYEILKV